MTDSTDERSGTVPRALGHLRVALDDSYLRASHSLGLTPPQAELLCAARRPAAVGRLAHLLRCDRTNVTRLVDRAVSRGWVERRPAAHDGRVSMIGLTHEGERLAELFIATLEAQLAPPLTTWPRRRLDTAVEILNELAEALDRAAETAQPPQEAPRPQ